jgi:hypothetical protein
MSHLKSNRRVWNTLLTLNAAPCELPSSAKGMSMVRLIMIIVTITVSLYSDIRAGDPVSAESQKAPNLVQPHAT